MSRHPDRHRIHAKSLPARIPAATDHLLRELAMKRDTSVADLVAELIHHALECEGARQVREPAA